MRVMSGTHVLMGNHAIVEGAIAAGCRFFAGYPITPQNEIPERMSERLPQAGGTFIQMEDEIASIAACYGASLAGAKAMTSTSGPGFSLMQEFISLIAMNEIPVVICDVQRTGPGSGIVSLPHQGDVMQSRWGGNGDYEVIAIAPATSQEAFDFTIDAFNLAEEWRTPAIILSDAFHGHIMEKVVIPPEDEIEKRVIQRKESTVDPKRYIPFTRPERGEFSIPPPPKIGTPYFPAWLPSVTHNELSFPILDERGAFRAVRTICEKIRRNEEKITRVEKYFLDDADVAVVTYGLPYRTAMRAVKEARENGIKAGLLRLVTVWPFASREIAKLAEGIKKIIVPEINLGQIFFEVERVASRYGAKVELLPQIAKLHEPKEILAKIKEVK